MEIYLLIHETEVVGGVTENWEIIEGFRDYKEALDSFNEYIDAIERHWRDEGYSFVPFIRFSESNELYLLSATTQNEFVGIKKIEVM